MSRNDEAVAPNVPVIEWDDYTEDTAADQNERETQAPGDNAKEFESFIENQKSVPDSKAELDRIKNMSSEEDHDDSKAKDSSTDTTEVSQSEKPTKSEEESKVNPDLLDAINRHYKMLSDQGLLLVDEDYKFNGDIKEVLELDLKNRQEQAAMTLLQTLPDKAKEVIGYALRGGQDIDGMIRFVSENKPASEPPTSEEDARDMIATRLKQKGVRDQQIKYILEGYEDEGKLIDEAKVLHEEWMQEYNQQVEQKLQAEQAQLQQREAAQQQYINNAVEYLKEQKWDLKKKQQLYTDLFQMDPELNMTRAESRLHAILRNPTAAIMLTELTSGYDPKTGQWDLSAVQSRAKNEVTKDLMTTMEEYFSGGSVRGGNSSQPDAEDFDFTGSEIV